MPFNRTTGNWPHFHSICRFWVVFFGSHDGDRSKSPNPLDLSNQRESEWMGPQTDPTRNPVKKMAKWMSGEAEMLYRIPPNHIRRYFFEHVASQLKTHLKLIYRSFSECPFPNFHETVWSAGTFTFMPNIEDPGFIAMSDKSALSC